MWGMRFGGHYVGRGGGNSMMGRPGELISPLLSLVLEGTLHFVYGICLPKPKDPLPI